MNNEIYMQQLHNTLQTFAMGGMYVPVHIREAIVHYIVTHRKPGDFLCAVFKNDLLGALERADHKNLHALRTIVGFMYNHAPSESWGSVEKFNSWINTGENDND